jgi:hypothetical protein
MKIVLILALLLLTACGGGSECGAGLPAFQDQQAQYLKDCVSAPAPPASAASAP